MGQSRRIAHVVYEGLLRRAGARSFTRQYISDGHAPRPALRTSKPLLEPRQRERSASGPDQRLHVQLGAVGALPNRLHPVALVVSAASANAPTVRKSFSEGLDRHRASRDSREREHRENTPPRSPGHAGCAFFRGDSSPPRVCRAGCVHAALGNFPQSTTCRPWNRAVPVARAGFLYQDHVGARFCIEMLRNTKLAGVWCETLDDITLIWSDGGKSTVRVRSGQIERPRPDVSVALICEGGRERVNRRPVARPTSVSGTMLLSHRHAGGCER